MLRLLKRNWVVLLTLVLLAVFTLAVPAFAQEEEEVGSAFSLPWLQATIAFFLPLVISFFKKSSSSLQVKRLVAFVISAIVGVVTVGAEAGWTFTPLSEFLAMAVGSIVQVWVVAQVAYLSFWQGTAPEQALASSGVK